MVARRTFAKSEAGALLHRALSSKILFFGGLVAIVIVTCPGARGEGLAGLETQPLSIVGESFGLAADVSAEWLHATTTGPAGVDRAPARREAAPAVNTARVRRQSASPPPTARPESIAVQEDLFQYSSRAVPMLVGPVLGDPSVAATFKPMVGAAVGVKTWASNFGR